MKKIAVFIISFSIFLVNFAAVSAAPIHKTSAALLEITDLKNVEVILSDAPEVVKVGDKVELTATTKKQGSAYNDNWSNAVASTTVYDAATGTYISKAEFSAEKPGTYTISYCIDMTAGISGTGFRGMVVKTITVINPVTLIGADIRDMVITPVYKADGSLLVYSVSGKVYALWSDQTATPYSSLFFNFGPNETEKNVDVTITDNGIQYNFVVTVYR